MFHKLLIIINVFITVQIFCIGKNLGTIAKILALFVSRK